jgi:hypothetical protein
MQANSSMRGFSLMRKFFIKAFALVIGTSLIFNLLGSLADHVAPLEDWRVEHQQRLDNLEAKRDQIEAITLGNSHSDAVDYSVLGMEGQSLAFAAADLFEVEKYAALMADKLPNLKTVFIAISYYSFSRDNATFEPFRTRRGPASIRWFPRGRPFEEMLIISRWAGWSHIRVS